MEAVVAKKKPESQPTSDKEGFRTVGIRVSHKYIDWLTRAAKADRVTIAGFLDRAAADRAKAIGFTEPPPERLP